MHNYTILYPMFALVLLTVIVSLRMLKFRFRAVIKDNLHPGYFRFNRGSEPPEYLLKVEQHYTNLFETPVLFYVISILTYVLQFVDNITLVLAWGYVISRCIHAYVHLGSNTLRLRRNVFLVSVILLITFWCYIFIRMISV